MAGAPPAGGCGGRFPRPCLYICYAKAMTAPVEYGTKCLYYATNFFSVLIVQSTSWLIWKVIIFRNAAKRTLSVTVCEKFVPRLDKHDDVVEWNFVKNFPPPKWRAGCALSFTCWFHQGATFFHYSPHRVFSVRIPEHQMKLYSCFDLSVHCVFLELSEQARCTIVEGLSYILVHQGFPHY